MITLWVFVATATTIACIVLSLVNKDLGRALERSERSVRVLENRIEQVDATFTEHEKKYAKLKEVKEGYERIDKVKQDAVDEVCEQWRVEKQELRDALEEARKEHEKNADLYRCRTDWLFKTLHAVGVDLSNSQATVQKCFEILNGNRDEET